MNSKELSLYIVMAHRCIGERLYTILGQEGGYQLVFENDEVLNVPNKGHVSLACYLDHVVLYENRLELVFQDTYGVIKIDLQT